MKLTKEDIKPLERCGSTYDVIMLSRLREVVKELKSRAFEDFLPTYIKGVDKPDILIHMDDVAELFGEVLD